MSGGRQEVDIGGLTMDKDQEWKHWEGMTDEGITSWVEEPSLCLLGCCDRCGKRRPFLRLYDVYPNGPTFGLVCADCLIVVIGVIYGILRSQQRDSLFGKGLE